LSLAPFQPAFFDIVARANPWKDACNKKNYQKFFNDNLSNSDFKFLVLWLFNTDWHM
jgi:hypothetical protein